MLYEQEGLRRVLVRKRLVTNEELLEEVKVYGWWAWQDSNLRHEV